MRLKVYILAVLTLAMILAPFAQEIRADSAQSKEYQVKAAFLYNFTKFVDWPEEKRGDVNEPITIGIIGKDSFGKAFEPLKGKKAKCRSVAIKRFEGFKKKSGKKDKPEPDEKIEAIRKCHLLFICPSEQGNIKEIIKSIKGHCVLTVGDIDGFLEAGGIIKFTVEENKVRFEINNTAAKRTKLKISSQLLRLAKRVVEEKKSRKTKS
jgi:hypothetical protein